MHLTLTRLLPFLPSLSAAQQSRATALVPVVEALLNNRYGGRITEANEVIFVSAAADAVARKLNPRDLTIAQQSIGPASVRYTDKGAMSSWFWPEELEQLDAVAGLSGVSTVRMAAPDAIRFGNVSYGSFWDSEDC